MGELHSWSTTAAHFFSKLKIATNLINATLLLQLLLAVALALVVPGKEDPAAHDVTLVTPGSERRTDSGADEDLSVVSVVGYRTFVPTWSEDLLKYLMSKW